MQIITVEWWEWAVKPSRRAFLGSPQVWAGRCWALMILTYTEVDILTGWNTTGTTRRGECPRSRDPDDKYCWLGFPHDNRIYAFYVAGAIILACFFLFLHFRKRIDPRDLRSMKLVGLALLQVLIGFGLLINFGLPLASYGIHIPHALDRILGVIWFWVLISGLARFLLLLRNPAKIKPR